MTEEHIHKTFNFLPKELVDEIVSNEYYSKFQPGDILLRQEQYVKVIPFVLSGLVKVFTKQEEKELLIYYIKPKESCIMSFSAGLSNIPSKIEAICEENTELLLVPVSKVSEWLKKFPEFNELFFQQYNQRYFDLIQTLQHVFFDKLDKRLLDYLKEKSRLLETKTLNISHRQIANDMGSAREVISRLIKKLENQGFVKQEGNSIKILNGD